MKLLHQYIAAKEKCFILMCNFKITGRKTLMSVFDRATSYALGNTEQSKTVSFHWLLYILRLSSFYHFCKILIFLKIATSAQCLILIRLIKLIN